MPAPNYTRQQFIDFIAPYIVQYTAANGYNYPSAIIAQACVESYNGNSALAYNDFNYFGMTIGSAWHGQTIKYPNNIRTFRKYDNFNDGMQGYFDFINYARYANLRNATSSYDYLDKITNDGWTSPGYQDVCYQIVVDYNLTQYDNQSAVIPPAPIPNPPPPEPEGGQDQPQNRRCVPWILFGDDIKFA